MYTNQDIYRFHSSTKLARYRSSDTLIMLPLRVETKIMEKRYAKWNDQHNILFPLQDIWNCIGGIEAKSQASIEENLLSLLNHIDKQEIITHDDKARLQDLWDLLKANLEAFDSENISQLASSIDSEMENIISDKAGSINKGAILVKEMRHHARELSHVNYNPPYDGRRRDMEKAYSCSVFYKAMAKHIQEAIWFFDSLKRRLGRTAQIDAKQKKALLHYLSSFSNFSKSFSRYKGSQIRVSEHGGFYIEQVNIREPENIKKTENAEKLSKRLRDNGDATGKQKTLVGEYRNYMFAIVRFVNKVTEESVGEIAGLINSKSLVRSQDLVKTTYTVLAEMLLNWRLKYISSKDKKDAFNKRGLTERLEKRARNTLFTYMEEKRWIADIVGYYNSRAQKEGLKAINLADLDKNDAYILKRSINKYKTGKCLCVRIYPDELAVSQLEKTLTSEEISDGREFFKIYFRNEGETKYQDRQQAAWDWLCKRYVPYRAAYIIRTLARTPNIQPVERNEIFSIPVSTLLPNRFAVQATIKVTEGRDITISRYGNRLPKTLQCGLNMNSTKKSQAEEQVYLDKEADQLKFRGDIRWMTDYEEAEKMGMAVTIPLAGFKYQKNHGNKAKAMRVFEFRSVYVTGYREFDKHERVDSMLKDMFESHLFSEEGMDIVPIGTPTNILDDKTETTYDTSEAKQNSLFFALVKRCLAETKEGVYSWRPEKTGKDTDAAQLNLLFNLGDSDSPFAEISNRRSNDLHKTRIANEVLLDYYAKDNRLLRVISENKDLRDFFINCVVPRGHYPTLRIGAQPYGLIPVGDFRNMKFRYDSDMGKLHQVLMLLTEKWNAICRMNNVADSSDEYSNSTAFLKTVSRTPGSNIFYEQDAIRYDNFLSPQFFRGAMQDVNPLKELSDFFSQMYEIPMVPENISSWIPDTRYIPIKDSTRPVGQSSWAKGAAGEILKKISSLDGDMALAERYVSDFFDLFYYRLDAWMQGILTQRLCNRSGRLMLGCFGWVFDLKEATRKDRRIPEYLLAPSVNQALTACVLKGAYNNAKLAGSDASADVMSMNINLSSERVRKALRIIRGIRNGLAVGAILGADLERLLHDKYKENSANEMDRYIWPLRLAFPIVQDLKKDDKIVRTDKDNSPSVINGALLIKSLQDQMGEQNKKTTIAEYFSAGNGIGQNVRFMQWWSKNVQGTPLTAHIAGLIEIFQDIYDSYDALMDVVLSESVYQLCQGNADVVTSLINALENESMLPEPMVTEIPVEHARIENKVIVCVKPEKGGCQQSPMAMADPSLNAWIKSVLGSRAGQFEKYGISAADLVYLSKEPECMKIYISYKCGDEADSLNQNLSELLFVADTIRRSLTSARILHNEDLMIESPREEIIDNIDLEEIKANFAAAMEYAEQTLERCSKYVETAEGSGEDSPAQKEAKVAEAKGIFENGFKLGMSELAHNLAELDAKEALSKISSLLSDLQVRIKNAKSAVTPKKDESNTEIALTINDYTEAFRKLLSGDMMIVPTLTVDTKNVPQRSLAVKEYSNVEDDLVIDEWIRQMADVRQNMQHIYQQKLYMDWQAIEDDDASFPSFKPLQLVLDDAIEDGEESSDPNRRIAQSSEWLGEEVENESSVKDANVYLAMNAEMLQEDKVKGMVMDFWTEKIPLKEQTAGLAFGFDQPDAEPAQAILLSIGASHKKNSRWTEEKIQRSIRCAKHLMVTRCVEPDHIRNDKWASSIFPLINPLS